MQIRRFCTGRRLAFAVAVSWLTLSAHAALVNGGFETGDFTGWAVGGNSLSDGVATDGALIAGTTAPFTPAFVNAHGGTFAAFALVRCAGLIACPARELITLSQVVSVVPSTTYSAGFFLGNDSPATFGTFTQDADLQIFVDGVGLLPSGQRNIDPGSTSADMKLFSGTFPSGGRTTVTVMFQIIGSGTARAGASFDDFFVEPVPAPETGSTQLIAAGLCALIWHRRPC
jgi:hypothetical protein